MASAEHLFIGGTWVLVAVECQQEQMQEARGNSLTATKTEIKISIEYERLETMIKRDDNETHTGGVSFISIGYYCMLACLMM